jgi:hypothetical protein
LAAKSYFSAEPRRRFLSPQTVISLSKVISHALFQLSIFQKLVFAAPWQDAFLLI